MRIEAKEKKKRVFSQLSRRKRKEARKRSREQQTTKG